MAREVSTLARTSALARAVSHGAVFAKVRPFLNQLRKRTDNPDFMANLEGFILRSKAARKRFQLEIQGSAVRRKKRK